MGGDGPHSRSLHGQGLPGSPGPPHSQRAKSNDEVEAELVANRAPSTPEADEALRARWRREAIEEFSPGHFDEEVDPPDSAQLADVGAEPATVGGLFEQFLGADSRSPPTPANVPVRNQPPSSSPSRPSPRVPPTKLSRAVPPPPSRESVEEAGESEDEAQGSGPEGMEPGALLRRGLKGKGKEVVGLPEGDRGNSRRLRRYLTADERAEVHSLMGEIEGQVERWASAWCVDPKAIYSTICVVPNKGSKKNSFNHFQRVCGALLPDEFPPSRKHYRFLRAL